MPTLILVRHGQSEWNLQNRFTGWWDVDLTDKGVSEAKAAGALLKERGVLPTICFTSVQTRAIRTAHLALLEAGRVWIPVTRDWHLNERHYGGLTGLDKQETRDRHGDEQVHIWRRSFDTPPPPIEPGSQYDPANDVRYEGIDVPSAESLKMTIERVLPYWEAEILPVLASGETVVISAHGNSLRALVKHLSDISDEDITGLEIPTGQPIIYEFDDRMQPGEMRYLKDI
ncbi:Phosphoglycerate mutase (2,3-diphosphoglycerate-dependent) [Alteripontixanthobacter maritimus]|uniref:2,3-bisphosphoglycerate-dependent phosphoglycerate mutase n=1 Tax=Alteripontixanthobacter maritimus TaxID=2161824 RepID=A0A369Q8N1_9SPHN|nr:2,3-diphosphoglycerate-dependent phosphoglycerate mutase [Alteripontixanthobacter maritimus]RDC61074.1 Phosphoglycerate mutase (2,3-diphosphoglycerate-dependent) [Alteripontixanthobacter maritimus]